MIKDYTQKVKNYESEKEAITKDATNFQNVRDESKKHSGFVWLCGLICNSMSQAAVLL